MQRGWRAGNLVALAPLCSDLPIIVLAVLLESRLPPVAFAWLGIIGGLFVIYLGIDTIRTTSKNTDKQLAIKNIKESTPDVLWRATITNALNPHPYLFWGTVGAQVLVRIIQANGIAGGGVFLLGFYVLLVGSKLLLAFLVSRGKGWLQGKTYRTVLTVSGILLLGLGIVLLSEGIRGL